MAKQTLTITAKIKIKSGKKGFQLEGLDGWLNATDEVVPYLAKLNKGDLVTVTYNKEGVKQEAIKIVTGGAPDSAPKASAPKPEIVKDPNKKYCSCGKEIKNKAYDKCFECNKKTSEKTSPPTDTELEKEREPRQNKGGGFYGTPEDVAGKEVGCAAGCAAAILAGSQKAIPEILNDFRALFNGILEHIRANK